MKKQPNNSKNFYHQSLEVIKGTFIMAVIVVPLVLLRIISFLTRSDRPNNILALPSVENTALGLKITKILIGSVFVKAIENIPGVIAPGIGTRAARWSRPS